MRDSLSDKFIAWLALLSGLCISGVAVYYSVIGLTSIFAAAFVPIIVMGVALEVSKLVATIWLKQNWDIAPKAIRTYLLVAIVALMLITSMGIFGFLSKAHLDQGVPTGDIVDKVALIDEKIKTQRENIDVAKKALKQLDESVDQVMSRSSDERGADKAAALRRAQQRERTALQNDIARAQTNIAALNEERAPVAKELRKVEAEVGPIKYISNFIYGETEQATLEKAVTWVIILIVLVFDPLAVVLLLAAQTSFQQFRKNKIEEPQPVHIIEPPIIEEIKQEAVEEKKEEPMPEPVKEEPMPKPVVEETKPEPQPVAISKLPGQFIMRNKVFRRPPPPEPEPVPEQPIAAPPESNINSDDYVKTSQLKREAEINLYAELVKTKQITMANVPDELQPIVKTKV